MECFIGFSVSLHRFPIVGKLIQLLQKNKFSHCFFAVYVRSVGKWFAIDATAYGVKIHELSNFQKHHRLVKKYPIHLTEEQKKAALLLAINHSYVQYSKLEILGNLIQMMFNLKRNPLGQGKNYTRCNELCGEILRDIAHLKIPKNLDGTDLIWLDEYLALNLKE